MTRIATFFTVIMYMLLITSTYAQNPNTEDTARNADVPDTKDIFKIDEDTLRDLELPAVIKGERINKPPSLEPPGTTFPKEINAGRGVKVQPQVDPLGVIIEIPAKDMIPYLKKN